MSQWIESYRGVVSAWECDVVEHFTIAYYFEKFADASRNFLDLIGERDLAILAGGAPPSRFVATFQHELRGGSGFHMLSAVLGIDGDKLRLGHQMIDTTSGKVATWIAETMAVPPGSSAASRSRLAAMAVSWPGPEVPAATSVEARTSPLTARDRVKPWEVDEQHRLSLPDHVHRLSGAGMHFLTSIGMTGPYMHENRRGISTFLLDLELQSPARLGERIGVASWPIHLGNTSLRYVHRMTGADGRLVATMIQGGVHLDLDARRPTAMPPAIRDAIAQRLTNT